MTELADKKCVPCEGGAPKLPAEESERLLSQLPGWTVERGHHLLKSYGFPDFVSALAFVNRVGALAEDQGHHPDIYLSWGQVGIQIWTHKVDGLTESDFIFAAKLEAMSPSAG